MNASPKVVIPDIGIGNLGAIQNMLQSISVEYVFAPSPINFDGSSIILPGVGSFDAAMTRLTDTGWDSLITEASGEGVKLLGLCLGAQILGNRSDEGALPGLGILDFGTKALPEIPDLPRPRMGWAEVSWPKSGPQNQSSPVARYYFAHSYYMDADDSLSLGYSYYGSLAIPVVVGKMNVLGVQFHPEKSHRFGKDFFRWYYQV